MNASRTPPPSGIRHPAIVRGWAAGMATVEVLHEPDGGCAACAARASCGLAGDSRGKPSRTVTLPWGSPLAEGRRVAIRLRPASDWKAIGLAFFLPAACLGLGLGLGYLLGLPDPLKALLSLAALALYGAGLFLGRDKLARAFAMTIEIPPEDAP